MHRRLGRWTTGLGLLLAGGLTVAAGSRGEAYPALARFARAVALVENGFPGAVDADRLVDGALQGMMATLDPYSVWLPPAQFAAVGTEAPDATAAGVGLALRAEADALVAVGFVEGGPAWRAGVSPGDTLLAIDGVSAFAMSPAEAGTRLSGPAGSTVTVVIWPAGADHPDARTLRRAVAPVRPVTVRREGPVAVLRIPRFPTGTAEAVRQALAGGPPPPRGWVVDLRGNPGGLVEEAVAVADAFLSDGVIAREVGRAGGTRVHRAHRRTEVPTAPVRILVDAGTASAAEVLAAALQDHRRAEVLGSRTFGKATLQEFRPLGDGSGLRLTVAAILPPSGRSFEGVGITPDHRPQGPGAADVTDPLLAQAIDQLLTRDP